MSEETAQQPADTPAPPAQPAQEGRYSVNDDGQIFYQENPTNPLPGEAIGRLEKGEAMLSPRATADGRPDLQDRLDIHIRAVLEPLFKLKQSEGDGALVGAAAEIGSRLYEHLGVMHRSDLEDQIALLDADQRKMLRSKGVRLGPVLVFLPALVKPAAIKMRALLWGIWNDKSLPMARPADGRVSEVVDPAAIDAHFYRMIGYPVFGPRCIRIDMLDRVVTDVYDSAQQGVFEAKHKYAEWLGCNLDDLHAVLESMGHRRIKEEAKAEEQPAAEAAPAPEPSPEVVAAEEKAADAIAEVTEVITQLTPKAPPVTVKFMLRRGKMSDSPQQRRQHGKHRKPDEAGESKGEDAKNENRREKKFTPKKPYDPNRPKAEGHARGGRDGEDRPRKPKFDRNKDKERNREARVYTFEGKKTDGDDDSNPFAILKNLKK